VDKTGKEVVMAEKYKVGDRIKITHSQHYKRLEGAEGHVCCLESTGEGLRILLDDQSLVPKHFTHYTEISVRNRFWEIEKVEDIPFSMEEYGDEDW